jgi:hypothetical protein
LPSSDLNATTDLILRRWILAAAGSARPAAQS